MEADAEESGGFVTSLLSSLFENPVNIALIGACGFMLYKLLTRQEDLPPPVVDPGLPPLPQQDMTVAELRQYDGKGPDGRILVAVNGKVFDVTRGSKFYGPDGPYGVFAGRDASRGLATFSFVSKDDYDDLSDLSATEMETVREWESQFMMKYDLVGDLLKSEEKASIEGDKPTGDGEEQAETMKLPSENEKSSEEAEPLAKGEEPFVEVGNPSDGEENILRDKVEKNPAEHEH